MRCLFVMVSKWFENSRTISVTPMFLFGFRREFYILRIHYTVDVIVSISVPRYPRLWVDVSPYVMFLFVVQKFLVSRLVVLNIPSHTGGVRQPKGNLCFRGWIMLPITPGQVSVWGDNRETGVENSKRDERKTERTHTIRARMESLYVPDRGATSIKRRQRSVSSDGVENVETSFQWKSYFGWDWLDRS